MVDDFNLYFEFVDSQKHFLDDVEEWLRNSEYVELRPRTLPLSDYQCYLRYLEATLGARLPLEFEWRYVLGCLGDMLAHCTRRNRNSIVSTFTSELPRSFLDKFFICYSVEEQQTSVRDAAAPPAARVAWYSAAAAAQDGQFLGYLEEKLF